MKKIEKALLVIFFIAILFLGTQYLGVFDANESSSVKENFEKNFATSSSLNNSQEVSQIDLGGHTLSTIIADSAPERAQGLSGVESLEPNQGMLFLFENKDTHGFWMKDMEIPIDIIWVDDNEVVGFEENVSPELGTSKIFYPPRPINRAIELNAGSVKRLNISVGDQLSL